MANSQLDKLAEVPPWQLGLAWLLGSALIGAGWYFLYFVDAQTANKAATAGLSTAKAAVTTAEASLANYEERVKEQAEKDKEIPKLLEKLPLDAATIDHLMGTFQREARGVGLELEKWIPQPEVHMTDFAKIPVEITAIGTWHEIGEFFRRVWEMEQPIAIEQIGLKYDREFDPTGFPLLRIDFTASAFRLLSEDEQNAPEDTDTRRKGGKRK